MLLSGERIGVAVSGGADSVALLYALQELFPDTELGVVHLNHCLRGEESDEDEAFVRELAGRLGLGVFIKRQEVGELAVRRGGNLEEVARHCRYQFFTALIDSGRYDKIATGHTCSDQAETVLFRLLRGAAGRGLSAIRPMRSGSTIRPMIDVFRDEVVAYLSARDIRWREDSSNADLSLSRNRLRHKLLPALKRDWNPRLERTLANTADWNYEEERYWEAKTRQLLLSCATASADGLLLDAGAVCKLSPAEQRRLLHKVLAEACATGAIGFDHIETVRELINSDEGSGGIDLPGIRVERSFGSVRIGQPAKAVAEFDLPLLVPGQTIVPGSDASLVETRVCGRSGNEERYNTTDWAFVDWDRVPKPLRLRNWHPGDRYRPVSRASEKKLKQFFQELRIHSWRRTGWPVITSPKGGARNEVIIWARKFGAAAEFAAGSTTRNLLSIQEFSRAGEESGIETSP